MPVEHVGVFGYHRDEDSRGLKLAVVAVRMPIGNCSLQR